MRSRKPKLAIVGAGFSAAILAYRLHDIFDISVFEKSRGVGGRAAVKRIDSDVYVHGAPFFILRDKHFKKFIYKSGLEKVFDNFNAKVLHYNNNGLYKSDWFDDHIVSSESINNVPVKSVHAIVKNIFNGIDGLDFNFQTEVVKLFENKNLYDLSVLNKKSNIEEKHCASFDVCVSTAPILQSFNIMKCVEKNEDFESFKKNNAYENYSRLALLIKTNEKISKKWDYIKLINDKNFDYIHRVQNQGNECFVLMSHEVQNDKHHAKELVFENIKESAQTLINCIFKKSDFEIIAEHYWKLCRASMKYDKIYYQKKNQELYICGDTFAGKGVESSFFSANQLAEDILNKFSRKILR